MDTGTVHNRFRLAVSLSDHPDHVRLRVRAGVAKKAALEGGRSLRHQSHRQFDLHANPIWAEELATGCLGHSDRLGDNHLDVGGHLEALQMGRCGSSALFCLGVDCLGVAVVDDVVELGAVMLNQEHCRTIC